MLARFILMRSRVKAPFQKSLWADMWQQFLTRFSSLSPSFNRLKVDKGEEIK